MINVDSLGKKDKPHTRKERPAITMTQIKRTLSALLARQLLRKDIALKWTKGFYRRVTII
jgi:hypothetical protein